MSIALVIHWPDKDPEVLSLAGQRTAEMWAAIAKSLNLKYMSGCDSFVGIYPEMLSEMMDEVVVLREAIGRGVDPGRPDLKQLERFAEALGRLRDSSGWRASIG